ncbi:MAG: homocysteine S-methyltransferase family protein, partial [Bacteroidales bacterium]|nr:homocysteine S-methyltransferase family protein [Bacteroidales bacterium]
MKENELHILVRDRILVLDGAMGTMIQQYGLAEEDYRGEMFKDHPVAQKGNNDLLNITQPGIIREIHRKYLEAGADILSTNTFNANAISMADYDMCGHVYAMNREASRLAREVVEEYGAKGKAQSAKGGEPDGDAGEGLQGVRPVWVAGSMGPTNKTASMSAEVSRPASRAVSFEELRVAYGEQARG